MKRISLIAVVLVASAQMIHAASISVTETDVAGGVAYALTLNATTAEQFNTFKLSVRPEGSAFVNPGAGAFPADVAGTNKSFVNPLLSFPSAIPGGQGLTLPAQSASETEVYLEAGLLGGFVDASQGIFLANVVLPVGAKGIFEAQLDNTGVPIQLIAGTLPLIPEPASLVMLGTGLMGLVLRRRNG